VRIRPFQYDPFSGIARFCPDWAVSFTTEDNDARILSVEHTLEDGKVTFASELTGAGSDIVLASRVEGVQYLSEIGSSSLEINGTTHVDDAWLPGQMEGTFDYIIEIMTSEGYVLDSCRHPFTVGERIEITPSIKAEPLTFDNDTTVDVVTHFPNPGSKAVEGTYSVCLMDNASMVLSEFNGSLIVPAGGDHSVGASFDMEGLTDDLYYIRSTLTWTGGTGSSIVAIANSRLDEEPPIDHILLLDYDLSSTDLIEGGSLWINGTLLRDDERAIPSLAVACWIGERDRTASALTDGSGYFSMELENVSVGNWTGSISYLGLDLEMFMDTFSIVVRSLPVDDNDTIDDNDTSGDGNGTDDGPDDNNTADDDGPDGNDTDDDGGDDGRDDVGSDEDKDGRTAILIACGSMLILFFTVLVVVFLLIIRRDRTSPWDGE
jgi:hypothetical protein